MKHRAAELAQRRAELLTLSNLQREELTLQVEQIALRLDRIDGRIDAVRRFLTHRWLLLGVTAAVVVLLGPRKLFRIGTRGVAWIGAAQRATRLVQRLRSHLD